MYEPVNFLAPLIDEYRHRFLTQPEARLRMRMARAAHISYQAAFDRWPDGHALAAEWAWDLVLAEEELERCSTCGVPARDILGPDGKPLLRPRYVLELTACRACYEQARQNATLSEQSREEGARWEIRPARATDYDRFVQPADR